MKWEEIEKRLGEHIRNKEHVFEKDVTDNQLKRKVWRRIISSRMLPDPAHSVWLSVAATVVFILLSGGFFFVKVTRKNHEITQLGLAIQKSITVEKILNEQINKLQTELNKPERKNAENQESEDIKVRNVVVSANQNDPLNITANNNADTYDTLTSGTLHSITMPETDQNYGDSLERDSGMDQEDLISMVADTGVAESDSAIKLNRFKNSMVSVESSGLAAATEKNILHYRVDYEDRKSMDKSSQRPWKLTIQYQYGNKNY